MAPMSLCWKIRNRKEKRQHEGVWVSNFEIKKRLFPWNLTKFTVFWSVFEIDVTRTFWIKEFSNRQIMKKVAVSLFFKERNQTKLAAWFFTFQKTDKGSFSFRRASLGRSEVTWFTGVKTDKRTHFFKQYFFPILWRKLAKSLMDGCRAS